MDRDDAAKVLAILQANPDGISRAGLMAWARLRIAADLTDQQLDGALAALGNQVSTEAGFIRLARPGPSLGEERRVSGAWADPQSPDPRAAGGPGGARLSTMPSPELDQWPAPEPGAPEETSAFANDFPPESRDAESPSSLPAGWRAGGSPPRGSRPLMALLAVVSIGVLAILGRGPDGSSSMPASPPASGSIESAAPVATAAAMEGSGSLPADPRGSIAPADDLVVGSCFVIPAAAPFTDVEVRPCDVPHDGELVAVWDEPAGSAYPSESDWEASVDPKCRSAFETYTGLTWADQSTLIYGWFYPAEDAWQAGSRTVQCYLGPADGTLTASYRAAE